MAKSSTYDPLRRRGRNNLVYMLLERLLGCSAVYTRCDKQLRLIRDACRPWNEYSVELLSVRILYDFMRGSVWPVSTLT